MAGRAMLMMLPSSVAMSDPSDTLVRMSHLRSIERLGSRSSSPSDFRPPADPLEPYPIWPGPWTAVLVPFVRPAYKSERAVRPMHDSTVARSLRDACAAQ